MIAEHLARIAAIVAFVTCGSAADAHPHVWINYQLIIVCDKGTITGVEHVWAFDDMYTSMAIEGFDKNGDGKYDREELSELTKTNMEGLKDFDYFTFAKLGTADLKFAPPTDAWLEHTNGVLKLHFRLPLEKPVLAEAHGFVVSIYDPSFFIAFEPAKVDALKLSSAPAGCTAAFFDPSTGKTEEDTKKLGEAFAQQLGGQVYGMAAPPSVSFACKK